MKFRGSRTGACTREIVLAELQPHLTKAPAHRQDFLAAGHYLQTQIEDIVRKEGYSLIGVEGEGVHEIEDFTIVGHVDGVLEIEEEGPYPMQYLLEVKCVQNHNYKALQKLADWRDKYGYYIPQAQCYLHFPSLEFEDGTVLGGPWEGTHFYFYNRDTAEQMSSLPGIKRPNHEYRPDMYEPRDESVFNDIVQRHREAAQFIEDKAVPEYCDKEGHCFFCGRGFPRKAPR